LIRAVAKLAAVMAGVTPEVVYCGRAMGGIAVTFIAYPGFVDDESELVTK
jgi:hypothetical protein